MLTYTRASVIVPGMRRAVLTTTVLAGLMVGSSTVGATTPPDDTAPSSDSTAMGELTEAFIEWATGEGHNLTLAACSTEPSSRGACYGFDVTAQAVVAAFVSGGFFTEIEAGQDAGTAPTTSTTAPSTTTPATGEADVDGTCRDTSSTITVDTGTSSDLIADVVITFTRDDGSGVGEAVAYSVVLYAGQVNEVTIPTPGLTNIAGWSACSVDLRNLRTATPEDVQLLTTPYTPADLDTILGPAVTAWLAEPSGPTFDAIAAAATSILTSGRPTGSELIDSTFGDAQDTLRQLATYPGSDQAVVLALDALAFIAVQTPFILRTGTYLVNSEVPPGTYRAVDVSGCYWATLDEAGEINNNNFVNSAPQVLMTVNASDFAVENDCGLMVQVS